MRVITDRTGVGVHVDEDELEAGACGVEEVVGVGVLVVVVGVVVDVVVGGVVGVVVVVGVDELVDESRDTARGTYRGVVEVRTVDGVWEW